MHFLLRTHSLKVDKNPRFSGLINSSTFFLKKKIRWRNIKQLLFFCERVSSFKRRDKDSLSYYLSVFIVHASEMEVE